MRNFVYIFVFVFSIQINFSQTHIYQHFGVDEGLPSSEVYDVYQDKQGYVWFATDRGLSRYNGYEFENFTTKEGLPDNTILDFYPQENGQIWCYGYNSKSLFYFNEVFDGFKVFKFNDRFKKEISSTAVVKSVYVKKNGTLQLAGYGMPGYIEITSSGKFAQKFNLNTVVSNRETKLVAKSNEKFFFLLYHDYNNNDKNSSIIDINYIPTSRIDVRNLNNNYTIFIDRKLGVFSKKHGVTYYETKQYPIGIKRVTDTTFFVGYYSKGAEIRDVNGKVLETFLPQESVSSFFIDAEGGYWFTTLNDGVFYIKNPNIKTATNQHIVSLVKDHNNNLFMGFNSGNIASISKNKIKILHKGLNNDKALVEFDENKQQFYGYSDQYLINYTSKEESYHLFANKLPEQITSPLLSASRNHFLKLDGGVIARYKLDENIHDVCFYRGNILIGASSGLLIQENDTIIERQSTSILTSRIDDIDVNQNTQKVYMATQGNGIVVYGDTIFNIAKKDGLTNDVIEEVHIENDSTIWACSNSGLNRVIFTSDSTYNVSTLTKSKGLISNDINDVEIINDTVWVATEKGLSYFKKEVLEKDTSSKVLSLSLKEILVNNTSIDRSKVKFKNDENSIKFKLQAISLKNNNQINYQYRLKEVDTTWQFTKNRSINFSSLSPGNYTFQAKADLLHQSEIQFISYEFIILPPFWKSWWFYSLCFLLLGSVIYLFFRIRVLTYNKDVTREFIRLLIKRLKRKELLYKFRANGEDFKVATHEILYINSQGNYLDIITNKKKYTIRCKIGDFIKTTPDTLEYLRVHRSYIIRIDKITSKGKNWVMINDVKIPVGETYLSELDKIQF